MDDEVEYDCSVIIPQLGLTDLTRSLVEQVREFEARIEIISVINDETETPLIKGCSCVYLRERNLSRAWNAGVECSSAKAIVLLNNDVTCTGPFTSLLSNLISEASAIAGPRKRRERFLKGRKILEGWCFAFHRDTWKALGGFDETMELYFSDADFMWRAIQSGVGIKAVELPLRHMGHKTAHNRKLRPDRHKRYIADETRFREKHADDA